LNFNLLSTYKF